MDVLPIGRKRIKEFLFFTKEELTDTVKELSLKCFNKTQEYLSLKERADSLETNTIAMESQYKQLRVRNNTLQNLNGLVM